MLKKIPLIQEWIETKVAQNEATANSLEELPFVSNLRNYFSQHTVSKAKYVLVSSIPKLPLTKLGLQGLEGINQYENGIYDAITYKNIYFILAGKENNPALHFHELIHVVQWEQLGVETFIRGYGLELIKHGYRTNRLEEMAYRHQALFQKGLSYRVEEIIRDELIELLPSMLEVAD